MKKLITLLSASLSAVLGSAQPFEPREPFGEPYGSQWNLVRNQGQTFDLGGDFRSDVEIQSVGTTPSLYLFRNSRTGFTYRDPATGIVSRIDLTFVGENSLGVAPGLYHQTGMRYNFYEANTPDGVTGVEAGKHAIYEEVYPRIDFHVLSNPWGPKFYIVLRPGADADDLVMQVSGHDSLKIDISGDLKIWFENKFLRLREGFAYQQIGTTIVNVPWVAHYENNAGSSNVTFDLGAYDPTLPLILCIKPWLPPAPPTPPALDPEWSTYFPGSANDVIKDLTHDGSGNIYFTGAANSTNGLPITVGTVQQSSNAGEFDMIVGKVNPNYEMTTQGTWMTYFGSIVNDHGVAIAYSSQGGGRLAVCGPSAINSSQPMTYPMGSSWTNSNGYDLLALFDPALGIRTYCTHLLSGLPGYDTFSGPADVDYDVLGNLYLVGGGYLHNGPFNSEVTGPSGTQDYTSLSYIAQGGNYLTDAYIARFDSDMHLTWLSALGGPGDDRALACAVDHVNSRIVVVGQTSTANDLDHSDCPESGQYDFPLCYPGDTYRQDLLNGTSNCSTFVCGTDGFITVISLSNLKMNYSSYLGPGLGSDGLTDVSTDSEGNIYVAGWSTASGYGSTSCQWSADNSLVPCDAGGHFDEETGEGSDNHFIARLNESFDMTWSTWIAGEEDEYFALIQEIGRPRLAVDENDNVFMFGSTASGAVPETDGIAPFAPDDMYYSNYSHADPALISPATTYDTYLLKFDPETNLMLSTLFGGPGQDYACGMTLVGTRVYVSGVTGSAQFPTNAPEISGAEPYLVSVPSTSTGDLDAFMAQLGYDYTVGEVDDSKPHDQFILLYPNPAADYVTLVGLKKSERASLQVCDVLGRPVIEAIVINSTTVTLDASQLPSGSYLVRVTNDDGACSKAFLKL